MAAREIIRLGTQTREWVLPPRLSPEMQRLAMSNTGITEAGRGYYIERADFPDGTLIFCHAGRGRVWAGGAWQPCAAGQIYWMPPLQHNKYEPVGEAPWEFAWVFYSARPNHNPALSWPHQPCVSNGDPWPAFHAISGLYRELAAQKDMTFLDMWTHILHAHVLRSLRGGPTPDPLAEIWQLVDKQLERDWRLEDLAALKGTNIETLRQLSLQYTGRTPMRHVTILRLKRADTLLKNSHLKLDAIAARVGFQSPFALHKAFKRETGHAPGYFRRPGTSIDFMRMNGEPG